ncbi:MAG: hypothetical protein MHMPM18_001135 [Marteilia pararefringens]
MEPFSSIFRDHIRISVDNSNSTQMPNSALLKYPMGLHSDPTHQNFIPIHPGEFNQERLAVIPYTYAANALNNIQQVPLVMNNHQVQVDITHSKQYPQIHTNLITAIQNNDIIMLNNSMNILLSSYTQDINEAEWKDTIEVLNSFYMLIMSCDFLQKLYANGFNRIFVWPIESVISYLNPFEKDSEVFATLFIWLMNKHSLKPSQTIITFLMQSFFNSKNVPSLHSTLQLINKYDPNYELPAYIYNFMIANYQSESGN